MPGGRSIQLARVFGIRIGVDPSWFLVLFLFIWWLSDAFKSQFPNDEAFILATASALLFFTSVVLHELGHAVVAMRNGIGIAGIDLWLFGGLARMRGDTKTPAQEFKIAAAGPLVTLVFAGLCFGAGTLFYGVDVMVDGMLFESDRAGATLLGWLSLINGVLLVFNLIPGYPLDGGRIARAIVWWRTGDRERATRWVARLGRGFGWVLIGYGVFLLVGPTADLVGGIWSIALGYMLSQAARGAELQSRIADQLGNLRVSDVMDAEPVSLLAHTKLDRALDEFFLRYRWPWFPVVDATGRFLGLVSRQKVEDVPEALRPGSSVDQVMILDDSKLYRIGVDEPIEALLGSEGLQKLGAVMAVDPDGVLRGVVTIDRVRRALRPSAPAAPPSAPAG